MLPPKSIEPYLSTSPKISHSNSFTPPNVMKFHPEDTNHDTNGIIGIHRHNDMNGEKIIQSTSNGIKFNNDNNS